MAQSDSLFDLIDIRDHQLLQENLFNENGLERISQSNEITFVCRWRPPKLGGVTKRQPDWNGKVFEFLNTFNCFFLILANNC